MHLIYRHAHDVVYTEATVLARWQRFYFSAPQVLATKNHSHNTGAAPVPISAPAWVQCCGVRPRIRDPLTTAAK